VICGIFTWRVACSGKPAMDHRRTTSSAAALLLAAACSPHGPGARSTQLALGTSPQAPTVVTYQSLGPYLSAPAYSDQDGGELLFTELSTPTSYQFSRITFLGLGGTVRERRTLPVNTGFNPPAVLPDGDVTIAAGNQLVVVRRQSNEMRTFQMSAFDLGSLSAPVVLSGDDTIVLHNRSGLVWTSPRGEMLARSEYPEAHHDGGLDGPLPLPDGATVVVAAQLPDGWRERKPKNAGKARVTFHERDGTLRAETVLPAFCFGPKASADRVAVSCWDHTLYLFDTSGRKVGQFQAPASISYAGLSPLGTVLVNDATGTVYTLDDEARELARVRVGGYSEYPGPIFLADGSAVYDVSDRSEHSAIVFLTPDGTAVRARHEYGTGGVQASNRIALLGGDQVLLVTNLSPKGRGGLRVRVIDTAGKLVHESGPFAGEHVAGIVSLPQGGVAVTSTFLDIYRTPTGLGAVRIYQPGSRPAD
jgi:hypothetical protein